MSKAIKNFENALQRLIDGKPIVIKIPYSINNDTVALEAGRKRGAIKKSRPELEELIVAIVKAEAHRTGQSKLEKQDIRDIKLLDATNQISVLEEKLSILQKKYIQQLAQLNMQMYRNMNLQKELLDVKKSENKLIDFMKY